MTRRRNYIFKCQSKNLLKSKCSKYSFTALYFFDHLNKRIEGAGIFSRIGDPVPTFNWVFEYQLKASEILTLRSQYKRAEINLLADEKCSYHQKQVLTLEHIHLVILLL